VVSPSFQIVVANPPSPSPSRSALSAGGSHGVKTKVPPWLPVGVGAVLLAVLLLAGAGIAAKRRQPRPPTRAWKP